MDPLREHHPPASHYTQRAGSEFSAPSDREVVIFRLHGFGRRKQHAGCNRRIRSLLYQNERPRQTIRNIAVVNDRLGRLESDDTDVIRAELGGSCIQVQSIHIDATFDLRHDGLNCLRAVLEEILFTRL